MTISLIQKKYAAIVFAAVTFFALTASLVHAQFINSCSIIANPDVSPAPGAPITLTFAVSNTFYTLEMDGKSYKNGDSVVVNPMVTTMYKASIKDSTGYCSNTIAVPAGTPVTQTITTATQASPASQGPAVCSVVGEFKEGDSGDSVKAIQSFLVTRGYPIAASGTFDSMTTTAVKLFQKEFSTDILAPQSLQIGSGVWDLYTAVKARDLASCDTTPVVASIPVVTSTSTSAQAQQTASSEPVVCIAQTIEPGTNQDVDVLHIQRFLISQGYTKVIANGNYDANTKRAIQDFQSSYATEILFPNGFNKATGTWGENTAKKASTLGLCEYDIDEDVTFPPVTQKVETPKRATVCLSKVIKQGEQGSDVRKIQKFLRSYGYTKVEVTGYFGPTTKRAIEFFQKKFSADILTPAGYTKPTGQWGPRTAAKAAEFGLCN